MTLPNFLQVTILRQSYQLVAWTIACFVLVGGFPGCAAPQVETQSAKESHPMTLHADGEAAETTGDDAAADANIIFGTPHSSKPVIKLKNVGYTVGYSEESRTPLWVSYRLFHVGDQEAPEREDLFAEDDRVTNPVMADDYKNTGYDRGHLAPRAPIGKRYGKAAQDKTFLMTNMCPQVPGLNQRGWEALEGIISESWAEAFGELWVIAGPIFDNSASAPCKELPSDVRVPTDCYMVIVDVTDTNEPRALGVIMPNVRIDRQPLRPFVKTVDEIETLTGIDFLPALADDVEDQIEATDANHSSADWNIDQDLIPTFPGTARAIHVKDCD